MADTKLQDEGFVDLLEYVRTSRSFDFSGYKRNSLMRRIARRMAATGSTTYPEYQDFLEVHPEEFEAFFDTILINVTSFFRDPSAWEFVADEIVPRLVSARDPGAQLRVWSAGCATGQEAYTLAMVLCEALGPDQFKARVKIYGTDADERALARARQAYYSRKEVEAIPAELVERYFETAPGGYTFRTDLRRSVIFGRHDLVQDAPISRLDLLVCRNTLMYFNAETQARVLDRFRFALADSGFLFLGKAETLLTHSPTFAPVDLRLRVFAKKDERARRRPPAGEASLEDADPIVASTDLRGLALDHLNLIQLLVNSVGELVFVSLAARILFDLADRDLTSPIQNLEISYRPIELRTLMAEASLERRVAERKGVPWSVAGERRMYDVTVTPLIGSDGTLKGSSICFSDVTLFRQLQDELEQSNRDLETAYEELQSSNEELETTNEELQSTNEELETTNEELQSSNEELETTNEELQSTNDELHALNEQLHEGGVQLDRANLYLEGIVTGLRLGIVVLDRELIVQLWNRRAEDLWGLRADEVRERNFLNLEFGLPVNELTGPVRRCIDGDSDLQEVVVAARNRRGQEIECRILFARLDVAGETEGVILMMEERGGRGDGAGDSPGDGSGDGGQGTKR